MKRFILGGYELAFVMAAAMIMTFLLAPIVRPKQQPVEVLRPALAAPAILQDLMVCGWSVEQSSLTPAERFHLGIIYMTPLEVME